MATHSLLLADDSETIHRVIELIFADEDIEVVAVRDGDQAITRIDSDPPDIVLIDVGMPGGSGYRAARHIKDSALLKHIPVVLLTGEFEPVDHALAQQVKCDGLLFKPLQPQQVIARVQELLSGDVGALAHDAADVVWAHLSGDGALSSSESHTSPGTTVSRLVLVVEDDASVRRPLVKFLEMHGFSVATAETADEGLAALRKHRFQAAVVDLRLRHGSGRDVVISSPPEVAVVIFSGVRSEAAELEQVRPRTRRIEKPYSLVLLVETLEEMLAGSPRTASSVSAPSVRAVSPKTAITPKVEANAEGRAMRVLFRIAGLAAMGLGIFLGGDGGGIMMLAGMIFAVLPELHLVIPDLRPLLTKDHWERRGFGLSHPVTTMAKRRLPVALLLTVLVSYVGYEYQRRSVEQRQRETFERALAERQVQATERLLSEQMERDQCEVFVRSAALASGLSDRDSVVQIAILSVCSDPQSGIRQRLRSGAH